MPTFNDSDNKVFTLLPPGDYVFCVSNFECSLTTGGKTNGSPKFDVELEIEGHNGATVREILIDHPSCAFKIDTFLKSSGIRLAKGESFEFRKDLAESAGVRWINPIGLRGWCGLIQEKLPPREGKKDLTVNKVSVFYTNKEKLPARAVELVEDEPFTL